MFNFYLCRRNFHVNDLKAIDSDPQFLQQIAFNGGDERIYV